MAASGTTVPASREKDVPPFVVLVSLRFIVVSLAAASLLAFAVGRAGRIIVLSREARKSSQHYPYGSSMGHGSFFSQMLQDKEVPSTVYTSKKFGTAASLTSSNVLVRSRKRREPVSSDACDATESLETRSLGGKHLMVDMKGVNSDFLNSESRLVKAIFDTCEEAQLTLLSYHCHTMVPVGVSCIGILLENHLSFHTWPDEGVITLDLLTSCSDTVAPMLPVIQRRFGVSKKQEPTIIWAQKERGFKSETGNNDLKKDILENMGLEWKKNVASVETDFQHIDIYDVIDTRLHDDIADYKKSLSNDGSYQAQHPQLFMPERIIYLDGVKQSTSFGDAVYHETLVHPAMFAHENPQRVAIVGGGEGATLREVLKHRTVKEVVMVEIDEDMVDVSTEYIPTWSDCSDLVGSADVCFDDPRAKVYFEDALAWFIDRYIEDEQDDEQDFDVIIMDALDPNFDVAFSDELYTNAQFTKSLYNALSDDGILIIQTGEAPDYLDPPDVLSPMRNRAILSRDLESVGFESVMAYEEAHPAFNYPWTFIVAFTEFKSRASWYSNPAQVELAMPKRVMPTKSGQLPFSYFDGVTMASFQHAHKVFEATFCKQKPTPKGCDTHRGFNVSQPNAPASHLEVKLSSLGESVGRGVFAKVDIAEKSYVAMETSVDSIKLPPKTYRLLLSMCSDLEQREALDPVCTYASAYGFEHDSHGTVECMLDSSVMMFTNHGCNGTHNVGGWSVYERTTATEKMTDLDKMPDYGEWRAYNPVVDRNLHQVEHRVVDTAIRNIMAGEELFANYVGFSCNADTSTKRMRALQAVCRGEIGEVIAYGQKHHND